jgi:hypothetical protein
MALGAEGMGTNKLLTYGCYFYQFPKKEKWRRRTMTLKTGFATLGRMRLPSTVFLLIFRINVIQL